VDSQSIDWLAVRDLPGILPTQQRRSQETTVALLEAAAAMLRERSLDELSIEDLCKRVGVTIGAFYGRFESKDAFFSALMSLAVRKALAAVRAAVADADNLGAGLEEACRRVVEVAVDVVRRNVGVVRAASQYESDGERSAPPVAPWSISPRRCCSRGWAAAGPRRRYAASASRFK
jgi:AcrR family transcriptional regulator